MLFYCVNITVSTIKEMVSVPDSDVIKINEGAVKSEQFHDGKGASNCPQMMVYINNICICSITD